MSSAPQPSEFERDLLESLRQAKAGEFAAVHTPEKIAARKRGTKPNPELIDEENPELTDEWFARARPASEVLPPELYAALTNKQGA